MAQILKEIIDYETGEVLTIKNIDSINPLVIQDSDQLRNKRFHLLFKIQNILGYDFRVSRCHKFSTGQAQVFYSPRFNRCHFTGLVTCGSVWVCPICSAKILSKRSNEIKEVLEHHLSCGGGLYFVTFTTPHTHKLTLEHSLESWKKALHYFNAHSFYKSYCNILDIVGHIRSCEITFSKVNGWHVHFHYLYFTQRPVSNFEQSFKNNLLPLWKQSSIKAGFAEPNFKGIHVRSADLGSSDYFAKWGVHDELTKSNFKESKTITSYTPFQLVENQLIPQFIEYAKYTTASKFGIKKGLNFLSFSRKLNTYLRSKNIKHKQKTDEELVSERENKGKFVLDLTHEQIEIIHKNKLHSSFLSVANRNPEQVTNFLKSYS